MTTDSTTLRLPTFFSDGMVLQGGVPLPIWGWGVPGEELTVRLAHQSQLATADASGHWAVRFDPLPTTPPGALALTLEITGAERLTIRDVLIGEVWLCSGQSNMEWTLAGVRNAREEIAAANEPRIRQFLVPRSGAPTPQDAASLPPTQWTPATPETASGFTAVGYYFAREISRSRGGVPVGLLNATWGGTAIQSWMSVEALRALPNRYEILLRAKAKELADWPARRRQIEADTLLWEQRAAKARAAGQLEPPNRPWNPGSPDLPEWTPTNLYNGMIAPLVPYVMRGALWYQGESNAKDGAVGAAAYTGLLTDLIRSWRAVWNQGDFPFYFAQLPNWNAAVDDHTGVSWAHFRDGQKAVLATPNTGMAVTIDVGESEDIHPPDKRPVGERLARIALRRTYGKSVADRGPSYRAMLLDQGGRVRLSFDDAVDGFIVQDSAPRHFELAGEDRNFYPADAMIDGNEIVLSCPQVPEPTAVRYAWSNDPVGCNLYNREGLPAMPFRTDNW